MAELRELLHAASPPASAQTDLDDLQRRITLRRRTRRAVIVTVVVVVLPLLGVAFDYLRPALDPPDEPRRIEFLDRPPERSEHSERADRREVIPPELRTEHQRILATEPNTYQAFGPLTSGDAPLLEVEEPGLRPVSERDVVVEGRYEDDEIWQLGLRLFEDANGTRVVCFELSVATCSSAARRWNSEPLSRMFSQSSVHTDELPRWCIYGFVSEAIDRVQLDVGSGQIVDVEPRATSLEFPASIYGHCQDGHPTEGAILTVMALDARGDVIQQKDQRL